MHELMMRFLMVDIVFVHEPDTPPCSYALISLERRKTYAVGGGAK